MPGKYTTVLIVLFTLLLFVAAFVLLSTISPDTMQALADSGAQLAGRCVGSGAGSCDVSGF
jgi:hypothetical protein